jgi:PAS domain S-box-containing protein
MLKKELPPKTETPVTLDSGFQKLRQRISELESSISRRKELEDSALRDSAERFQAFADNTYDWEYWTGPDGRYVYMSPSCQRITGYHAEEFIQDPGLMERIIHPEDRDDFRQRSAAMTGKKSVLAMDFRVLHRRGAVRWIGHICRPVYATDGRYLGKRVSNRDISSRKAAEKALRASAQAFRTIFNSGHDAVIIYEPDGTVTRVNARLLEMFGVSRKDAMARFTRSAFLADGQQWEQMAIRWTQALEDKKQIFECKSRRLDSGLAFEVEIVLSKITLNGRTRVLCAIRDITDRKEAEAERMRREKLEGVLEMAGAACHELNQPMQSLFGYTELIRLHISPQDPLYEKTLKIQEQVERIATMTAKLMGITKYETRSYVKGCKIIDIDKASENFG